MSMPTCKPLFESVGIDWRCRQYLIPRLLNHADDLRKISHLHQKTLRKIPGIGAACAGRIRQWQKQARFSAETEWVAQCSSRMPPATGC